MNIHWMSDYCYYDGKVIANYNSVTNTLHLNNEFVLAGKVARGSGQTIRNVKSLSQAKAIVDSKMK
jgi:hypothetical protein